VSILAILFIGALVGWLMAAILEFDEGIFAHMLIGVLGSFLGSLAPQYMGHEAMFALTWGTVLWCLIGALLVAGIASAITYPNRNSGV
jgi:uncharacterized membrane protein YeaQ/YmgE (transglycosylase-associated protein family)